MTYLIQLGPQTLRVFNFLQYYLLLLYINLKRESSDRHSVHVSRTDDSQKITFDNEIAIHHRYHPHPWCKSFPGCTYSRCKCAGGKSLLSSLFLQEVRPGLQDE